RLALQFAGLPGLLYAEEPEVAVDGTAFLPAFDGILTVRKDGRDVRHSVQGDDLRLDGRFSLHLAGADPADGTSDVRGEGDFTYVAYGAVAAAYDWSGVAAAVGIGAVVLAALVWIAMQAKALLATGATGLVAGYARVHGSEVLEHAGRSHVYDMVKANPGVSFMELARSLSLGESTLTYHLRVLERNGFVSAVKDGRYLRYFDRASGLYAQDRKLLVAALRNRATAAIAQEILRTPGIAQHELAERFHVAPSTVNWHIRRLAELGLVDLRRDHPHTRYFVGESWATLPAEEQARFQLATTA
ncbi:MAG TPA: winged helix-turn-helix transcriptional regulator, partial [Candidatus Thermoplasmatota archaeon]|nr:winged helix-turn-helix transcriptional regulator [Candidatus Thermoplasmatota archaeon]